MDEDWGALVSVLAVVIVVVTLLVTLTGCADECSYLYCAPTDAAVAAHQAQERGL